MIMKLGPVAMLLAPITASAEIADKVPTYPTMWGISVIISVLVAALSYWKPLFIILAFVISGFLAASYVDMTLDDHFRQLVIAELGLGYLISGFLSAGLVVVFSIVAVVIRKRTKRAHGTGY